MCSKGLVESNKISVHPSNDKIIQIKQCTEPTEDLTKIHNALKQQQSKPFKQIKFVVHKPPQNKIETHAIAELEYG